MSKAATVLILAASLALPAGAGTLESSELCGECHRTIYRTWKDSAHARSLDNEIFLDAYRETEAALAPVCLKCHAPVIDVNADRTLQYRLTWEGVSCDVCHTLVSVDLSGMGPRQRLEPGPVKQGPLGDVPATGHEVAFSELHTTSLVCAGCHEYVNPDGTVIMSTYSEWKGSQAAAKGQTCQSCHMGLTDTDVEEPRAQRVAEARVNLHHVPGGHSLDQLHQALGLAIRPERSDGELLLELRLRNKGAGHAVPTGTPGRQVVLELNVRGSDGQAFKERRIYGQSFVDAAGQPITRAGRFFARGVELSSDTRIQPDEERRELFRFPLSRRATVYITAQLHYEHAGNPPLTFLSERRTLLPEPTDRR